MIKPTKLKLLASWDIAELLQNQADYLEETWEPELEGDEKPDKTAFYRMACDDSDFLDLEWGNLTDLLTEWFQKKSIYHLKAKGHNMGWTHQTGVKDIILTTNSPTSLGTQFLRQLLPDTDCTFYIYQYRNGLKVLNYHHDAPIGEIYYIKPFNKK